VSFTKRLERLEDAIRARGRLDTSPLYFRLPAGEDKAAELDRLVTAGKITDRDRDRVTFVVRTIIDPPGNEVKAADALGTVNHP
jgi:hypothetical protein